MSIDNNAFGLALKHMRNVRSMSQEDFSIVSSRTYISSLERGLKSPTLDKVEQISSCIGVHPLTLLTLAYSRSSEKASLEEMLNKVTSELREFET